MITALRWISSLVAIVPVSKVTSVAALAVSILWGWIGVAAAAGKKWHGLVFVCLAGFLFLAPGRGHAENEVPKNVRLKILFIQGHKAFSAFELGAGNTDEDKNKTREALIFRAAMSETFIGHELNYETSGPNRNDLIALIQQADILYLNTHSAPVTGMGHVMQVAPSDDNRNIASVTGESVLLATEILEALKGRKGPRLVILNGCSTTDNDDGVTGANRLNEAFGIPHNCPDRAYVGWPQKAHGLLRDRQFMAMLIRWTTLDVNGNFPTLQEAVDQTDWPIPGMEIVQNLTTPKKVPKKPTVIGNATYVGHYPQVTEKNYGGNWVGINRPDFPRMGGAEKWSAQFKQNGSIVTGSLTLTIPPGTHAIVGRVTENGECEFSVPAKESFKGTMRLTRLTLGLQAPTGKEMDLRVDYSCKGERRKDDDGKDAGPLLLPASVYLMRPTGKTDGTPGPADPLDSITDSLPGGRPDRRSDLPAGPGAPDSGAGSVDRWIVAALAGPVQLARGSEGSREPRPNEELRPDDVIETQPGAQVKLTHATRGTVDIGPDAKLQVRDAVSLALGLSEGEFMADLVPSSEAATAFTVNTPNATVRVLGTRFGVDHDSVKRLTTVHVERGEVEVTPTNKQLRTLRLKAGQQATIPDNAPKGLYVEAGMRDVRPNETVSIPIYLRYNGPGSDEGENPANMNFEMTYDSSVAKVQPHPARDRLSPSPNTGEAPELTRGNLLERGVLIAGNSKKPGTVMVGFAGKSGVKPGVGKPGETVTEVYFQAVGKPGDQTELCLAVTMINDSRGNKIPIGIIPGRVRIIDDLVPLQPRSPNNPGGRQPNALDAYRALLMSVNRLAQDLWLDVVKDGQVTSRDSAEILRLAGQATGG